MLITELARRAARFEWVERRLFEVVGAWAADESNADAVRLFAAQARHHAWRASMWSELAPVLHDGDPSALAIPSAAAEALEALASTAATVDRVTALGEIVLPNVVRTYERELADANEVSDAPVMRALQLLSQDAKQDWGAAARLLRSVVRTEEDNERAATTQSWFEVLLVPCWEV
jgi:hypothetical protein